MTPEEIPDFLQRYLAAFPAHGAAAMAAFHTENGTYESPASGVVKGRAAIEGRYRVEFTAFPDLVVEVKEMLVDGYRAVMWPKLTGTLQAPFFGITRTGKPLSFELLAYYRLEQEGIAAVRFFWDFSGAMLKTGSLKVKPV